MHPADDAYSTRTQPPNPSDEPTLPRASMEALPACQMDGWRCATSACPMNSRPVLLRPPSVRERPRTISSWRRWRKRPGGPKGTLECMRRLRKIGNAHRADAGSRWPFREIDRPNSGIPPRLRQILPPQMPIPVIEALDTQFHRLDPIHPKRPEPLPQFAPRPQRPAVPPEHQPQRP